MLTTPSLLLPEKKPSLADDLSEQSIISDDNSPKKDLSIPKEKLPFLVLSSKTNKNNIKLLYKGRKYFWEAKVNLHVHILQHSSEDLIEVIAFNPSTIQEADHLFLPLSTIFSKLDDDLTLQNQVESILLEYQRMDLVPPSIKTIALSYKQHRVTQFILDRLIINTKPTFSLDMKDIEKQLKRIVKGHSDLDRRSSMRKSVVVLDEDLPHIEALRTTINIVTNLLSPKHQNQPQDVEDSTAHQNTTNYSPRQFRLINLEATEIKRFGRSATLIGEIFGVKIDKNEELLNKIISDLNSNSYTHQTARVINQITLMQMKRNKKGTVIQNVLRNFQKFKNDNDLLMESLSFLHISDMINCQLVCKKWFKVLRQAIDNIHKLTITSRDFYFQYDFKIERIYRKKYEFYQDLMKNSLNKLEELNSPQNTSNQWLDEKEQMMNDLEITLPKSFQCKKVYVLNDTIYDLMWKMSTNLVELKFHYAILDSEIISLFDSFKSLRKLSLGIIKVDDRIRPYQFEQQAQSNEPLLTKNTKQTGKKPTRPSLATLPSQQRKTMNIGNRRKTTAIISSTNSPYAGKDPTLILRRKEFSLQNKIKVKLLRYFNQTDLRDLLSRCGNELTHLELSITIGNLDPDIFLLTPKLSHFTIIDSMLSPNLVSSTNEFSGNVMLSEFKQILYNIQMIELLILISDEDCNEAFLITDKRGKIIVVNEAWERMFGYSRYDVYNRTIDFLAGDLTDIQEFEVISEGIKSQMQSEEVTAFVYSSHHLPILCQIILLPNIAKFKGLPLTVDCLNQDFLSELALEHEENLNKGQNDLGFNNKQFDVINFNKNSKKDWRIMNKESSYHLLRFGYLSQPILPYVVEKKEFVYDLYDDYVV